MGHDRHYVFWALVYVVCGMSLGFVMAVYHHNAQQLSPEHVILVGLVLSLVYGVIHKLWLLLPHPFNPFPSIFLIMLHLHRAGALTMFTALLLMYGEVFLNEQIEPALAFAYIITLIATQTMQYMVQHRPWVTVPPSNRVIR